MRRSIPIIGLCVLFWILGCGTARAQDDETPVPADIRVQMRNGGISLELRTYPIGPHGSDVLAHLYAVPTRDLEHKAIPIRREDILSGGSVPTLTYYLDLFTRETGKLKRLNTAHFTEGAGPRGVMFKWLEPRIKRGPIFGMQFGVCDSNEWQMVVFPRGLTGEWSVSEFGAGFDEDGSIDSTFDAIDKRGFLNIYENWSSRGEEWTVHYDWNGKTFVKRGGPYFVIAASTKTYAEAVSFVKKHKQQLPEKMEILNSRQYARLTPGYYVVVLDRAETEKEAADSVLTYRPDGVSCYVKRAF